MFGEAERAIPSDDEMVYDAKVERTGRFHQDPREAFVIFGRFGVAARMIVNENQPRGMMREGGFDDAPGIDDGSIHRSLVDNLVVNDFILGVEIDDHERFMWKAGHFHASEINDGVRGGEDITVFHPLSEIHPTQVLDQPDERRRHGTDVRCHFEFLRAGIEHTRQATESRDEVFGDGLDILAGDGVGQQEFEKLVIVQPFGPHFLESLSQPLAMIEVVGLVCHTDLPI
jgi:hypothetical protein